MKPLLLGLVFGAVAVKVLGPALWDVTRDARRQIAWRLAQ